ncbi:MAG: DUF3800 domain-containing protein [Sulfuricurvum sp.]|uniref:DUF3800 domain-containing protein n=1 Tax=Sulfuricurvum sp. TaxID=2025608 RepID=UPI0025FC2BE2|nr:DUF3800 domain-containing protein [Sulfuricurvum sp.]MBV5320351.1 DUF3800 domain-containing protein [Sulfuricurvum sp.]
MNIYIDEAGVFVKPTENKCAVSVVGALILPENKTSIIFSKFEALKSKWGLNDTEVKGSQLNESQVASVIEILQKYNVMFEIVAIDMNIQIEDDITIHKLERAQKMISCITDDFNETLIKNLYKTKDEIESLPNQLYVQVSLIIELLIQIFQTTMLNYSLKKPKELEFFKWIVDAKDTNITTSEKIWKTLILPLAQSRSFDKPLLMIKEGDYSHFFKNRKSGDIPNYLVQHVGDKDPNDFFELNSVYSNIKFENSKNNLGVQLADILTTSIRRSMNGNLQKNAWKYFRNIIVMGKKQSITLINMSNNTNFENYELDPPYFEVIKYLDKTSKTIFGGKK